ncbi:porin [Cupriavidus basilensis]
MAVGTNYSILGQDSAFGGRADNSVKYVGTFSGLSAKALYSFGANTGAGASGESPGSPEDRARVQCQPDLRCGPFAVGAIYDSTNPGAAATGPLTEAEIRRAGLAGSYSIGPAKAYAGYRWAKALGGATLPGNLGANNVSNLYWLGLRYQLIPALSLTGVAYFQDFRGTKADPWSFVASADYALSKRTDAYLNLGYTKNKDGSEFRPDRRWHRLHSGDRLRHGFPARKTSSVRCLASVTSSSRLAHQSWIRGRGSRHG